MQAVKESRRQSKEEIVMSMVFTNALSTKPIIESEDIKRSDFIISTNIVIFNEIEKHIPYIKEYHKDFNIVVSYKNKNIKEVVYGLHQCNYISEFRLAENNSNSIFGYIYTLEHIYEIDENTKLKMRMLGTESMDTDNLKVLIKNKNLQKVF